VPGRLAITGAAGVFVETETETEITLVFAVTCEYVCVDVYTTVPLLTVVNLTAGGASGSTETKIIGARVFADAAG
jgi:hypothetical protein